ncbi:MAG: hypothetical protein ACI8ZM_004095 [Crocinitomix sp.]|jgi:hypothetical protein
MSIKQEELTVNGMIEASRILEGLERFRAMAGIYEKLEKVQYYRYNVQREFYELEKLFTTIESQLEELIRKSEGWESVQ